MASQPQLTYHAFPGGSRMNKVRIAAKYANIQLKEDVLTAPEQIKSAEYKSTKHPLGKAPALTTPQGSLFESNAILRYVARLNPDAKLYGNDVYTTSQVDQWLDFVSGEVDAHMWNTVYQVFGRNQRNDAAFHQSLKALTESLNAVNAHLNVHTFLVGNSISIADIHLAASLIEPFRLLFDEKDRSGWQPLVRWFQTVTGQAHWAEYYGTIRLCQQKFELPAVHHEESKKAEQKGDKAEKGGKKEAAPAAKKDAAPAAKKEDHEEGGEEKKEKNPLDLLPPTTFDLYAFKTLYVNAADKKEAFDFLWKNLDKQGFSIWFIHYQKAEGENTKLFLTTNLSEGTMQKLEHFRKYAFGSWGVYGEEPAFEIKGCLLWRGTEHPQEIKDLGSYEYHTFVKANVDDEKDRKKVEEYWLSVGEGKVVEGLRARDVSYFK